MLMDNEENEIEFTTYTMPGTGSINLTGTGNASITSTGDVVYNEPGIVGSSGGYPYTITDTDYEWPTPIYPVPQVNIDLAQVRVTDGTRVVKITDPKKLMDHLMVFMSAHEISFEVD